MKIYYKPRAKFYNGWNVIPGWTMLRIISYCAAHGYVRWHFRLRFFKYPFFFVRDKRVAAKASALKWRPGK